MEIDSSKLSALETKTPVKEPTEAHRVPGDEYIPSVGVVFENDAWLSPLFDGLKEEIYGAMKLMVIGLAAWFLLPLAYSHYRAKKTERKINGK